MASEGSNFQSVCLQKSQLRVCCIERSTNYVIAPFPYTNIRNSERMNTSKQDYQSRKRFLPCHDEQLHWSTMHPPCRSRRLRLYIRESLPKLNTEQPATSTNFKVCSEHSFVITKSDFREFARWQIIRVFAEAPSTAKTLTLTVEQDSSSANVFVTSLYTLVKGTWNKEE